MIRISTTHVGRTRRAFVAACAWLLMLAACGGPPPAANEPSAVQGAANSANAGVADPSNWPKATWPLAPDAALETRVAELLAKMTLEEKVGQVIQADIGSVTPADVRRFHLGSILAGGNSDPGGDFRAAPAQWLALADDFYQASIDTADGRTAVPIIFGIDAVHGHNNVRGATVFPHNIGLGATRNAPLVHDIARATALELRSTGMEWTFAPSLAVPRDDRWGRTYEGYSEDPDLVTEYARAVVTGLQGEVGSPDFLGPTRVLATAKHFLADGGTFEGKDQGDARIDEATLRDIHGRAYVAAIEAGAQSVMASFSGWNGVKHHGNRSLLTDVLRGPLAFGGFVVGDWNAHGQIPGCSNENCAMSLMAGLDMYMAPDSWRGLYENTLAQARSGEITRERLDEAVSRILRTKFRLGLFEQGAPSTRPGAGEFSVLAQPAHRALARQAVRESLVLLKNSNQLLPLDPRKRILVAGDAADSVMMQSGGWTLTWQGTGLEPSDFPAAQTIWQGLAEQIGAAGGHAELAPDGRYTRRPDVAIVVFGETPYAEFQGDIEHLVFRPGDERHLAVLRALREDGIPVVAVFMSGRPLWMNRELNASHAFVAAWLPGAEGGGVADVLLRTAKGAVQHEVRGRLPFSWPRHALQTPLNVGDAEYDPLFAFGFGLSYVDNGKLGPLSEESGVSGAASKAGEFFAEGALAPGLSMLIEIDDGTVAQVGALPAAASDDSLRVSAVDHRAQEDARRLVWDGDKSTALILAGTTAMDLNRQTNGDVLLVVTLRVDAAPDGEVRIGMDCDTACSAQVALNEVLARAPHDTWQRVGVPLKCFRHAGADMTRIATPFRIESAARAGISISSVELGTDTDLVLACPTG